MVNEPGRPKEVEKATTVQVVVDQQVKDVLETIADREHTTVSKLLRPELEQYAKAHASGNSQFTLDKSVDEPGFIALPTMGEILKPERLDGLPDKDLDDLAKAATARGQEIQAAINRRSKDHRTHFPAVRWPDE